MEKFLDVKIQFFADYLTLKSQEIESNIMIGLSPSVEKSLMAQSEILEEVTEKFDEIFNEILYRDVE